MSERKAALLDLTTHAWCHINFIADALKCPRPSVRRLIQELRREDYYIVVEEGMVKCYGKREALIPVQDPSTNIGGDDDADYQK